MPCEGTERTEGNRLGIRERGRLYKNNTKKGSIQRVRNN